MDGDNPGISLFNAVETNSLQNQEEEENIEDIRQRQQEVYKNFRSKTLTNLQFCYYRFKIFLPPFWMNTITMKAPVMRLKKAAFTLIHNKMINYKFCMKCVARKSKI